MPLYFLGPDSDFERKIRSAVPDLIRINDIEDIAHDKSGSAGEPNYVLLAAPARESGHFAKLVDMAVRHRGRIFFILISDDISAADYKRLVRTGGADWVPMSAVPQEVLEIIARRRAGGEAASGAGVGAPRHGPVIVSFVPSAGGVGNTTLAVEVGARLRTSKATAGRSICIVDLDFQNSHVCDHLDIEPRLQIEEISSNPQRLDAQLFDIFISRHASGLHVFAAPRTKFEVCNLNVLALDTLFSMISTRYDLIILDLPVTWFSWTAQIVAGSDGVVVTGVNTIPALRRLAETVTAVRDARNASSQMAVAVNRCELGMMGRVARRRHVEKVLGREKLFYVREDPVVLQCVNTGTPLVLTSPSRKAARDMAAIADFCVGLKSVRAAPT
jgi:pilus assembly protein CpaE